MSRPDHSYLLAHFTKNGREYDEDNPVPNPTVQQMSALQKLVNILNEKTIFATPMNWTDRPAVCFTECPWGSLIRHAKQYSPYGVGFTKKLIYSRNGNPVIYANPKLFHSQDWSDDAFTFVTPFVPKYASDMVKNQRPFNGNPVDYTHEREWRVAKDFKFQYQYVYFVVLKSVSDLQIIPQNLINEIGIEKFIFMDTYTKIEELWPTHLMD